MSFYYTLGNSGRKTGENGVCCILPFDKSLMFKVNTTPRNFDYFTSLDFFHNEDIPDYSFHGLFTSKFKNV